jgi:hypothetical protein
VASDDAANGFLIAWRPIEAGDQMAQLRWVATCAPPCALPALSMHPDDRASAADAHKRRMFALI